MMAFVAGLCLVTAQSAFAYDFPPANKDATTVSLYGSVRSGIIYRKAASGADTWDVGTVDGGDLGTASGDAMFSRLGIRAEHNLGDGLTAGLHIEKRLDNFRTRHQNVYLDNKDIGRITLGQQSNLFTDGVNWDGANLFGGNPSPVGSTRLPGIRYQTPSSENNPFTFSFGFSDSNTFDPVGNSTSDDMIGSYGLMAGYATKWVNVSAAYGNNRQNSTDAWGASASGKYEGFTWDVGYVSWDLPDEITAYGIHLGYNTGGAGNFYAQYEDESTDSGMNEGDWTIFGWSYPVGLSTRIIAEHRFAGDDSKATALALRVDF